MAGERSEAISNQQVLATHNANVTTEETAQSTEPSVQGWVKLEQITALKNCVADTLASYRRKRNRNKIGAIAVHVVTIGFTSVTTILLGWNLAGGPSAALKNYALLFSALATAASTLDTVFDFRALWAGYNVSLSRLKAVLARLNYLEASGVERLTRSEIEELYSRYDAVCVAMEKDYKDIRAADDA